MPEDTEACAACHGAGNVRCGKCDGEGVMEGLDHVRHRCSVCGGSGCLQCQACGGTGRMPEGQFGDAS